PAHAAAHRACAGPETAGALRTEAADLGTEGAAARTGCRGTRARDPSGTAERRGATALLLLTALVCRELSRLRRVLIVARRYARSAAESGAGWTARRRAEAWSATTTAPTATPRAIAEVTARRGEGARRVQLGPAFVARFARCALVARFARCAVVARFARPVVV